MSPADESVDADRPTASETTQVLHSRVDPDAFDDTIRQLTYAFGIWSPVIEAVIGVPASPANPLARQWLSRLQKSDAPVDELGYLHVCAFGIGDQRRAHPDAQPAPRRLTDPLHPDLWIAHIGDTVYVTVPRSISRASGMLRQLDITRETNAGAGELTAWWTDSNGDAWPMPGTDQYEAGFDGSGPRDLAAAASLLADDATSPVAGVHNCRARAEAGCEQLARLLTARQHPTLFRRITGPGGHTVWHTD